MASNQIGKCKVRWFHSKGAGLAILWVFSIICSTTFVVNLSFDEVRVLFDCHYLSLQQSVVDTTVILVLPVFLLVVVIGWLADTKVGNYRVFKCCCILLALSSVVFCILTLYWENVSEQSITEERCNLSKFVYIFLFISLIMSACVGCVSCASGSIVYLFN